MRRERETRMFEDKRRVRKGWGLKGGERRAGKKGR